MKHFCRARRDTVLLHAGSYDGVHRRQNGTKTTHPECEDDSVCHTHWPNDSGPAADSGNPAVIRQQWQEPSADTRRTLVLYCEKRRSWGTRPLSNSKCFSILVQLGGACLFDSNHHCRVQTITTRTWSLRTYSLCCTFFAERMF